MLVNRRWLMGSSLSLLAACATPAVAPAPVVAAPPPRPKAKIGDWGVDLAARDLTVKPGDDFFKYANGTWLSNTQIPADRSRWGTFDILRDQADTDVRAIIDDVAQRGGAPGTNERKIADFYNAYVDQAGIDAKGLAPAQADLAAIAALRNHEEAIRLIARPDMPVNSPIAFYISSDSKNPDRYLVAMTHAGLALPDREYYIRDDEQFRTIRSEYQAHVERMLTLAGQTNPGAKARQILALETAIAQRHWPVEDRRDVDKVYNLKTRAEVAAFDPRFPWNAMFDAAELGGVQELVVNEITAMAPLARLYRTTPLATWKAYLTYHYLANTADTLPANIDAERFAFYGHTLSGQPQQRERWKRGVSAVNGAMGEAIGQLYVQRHFPPEAKAQMQALVENLRRAYGARIDALTWMSAETKVVAREKLATFRPKIGYPDKWRDYSALEVVAGDAFGNAKRATLFEWRRQAGRLNQPTDRDEWGMTPQTINAYYNPDFNEIVFPAAILQPPFFDPNADPAVNYGAIGGVIGHEMGHGFDDQGAKQDARGILRDWWSEADVTAFQAQTQKLVAQYNGYEALPGLNVNGQFTLGENIGDNGGLQVSYYAYKISLNGAEAPVLDGLSGDQRFFLGWAQAWRGLIRDAQLRNQVLSDPHSPQHFRCNGAVRNMDAWYAAYSVQPGEALYLAPDDRVLIW